MAIGMRKTSFTAAVAVMLVALTSCAADSPGGSGVESAAPGGGSASAQAATTPPAPAGPCAEGTCRIEVAVGDVVAVPDSYGLGPIEITAITADAVEMFAPLTGSGYSMSGCSGGGGVSSRGGGGVEMSCEVGTAGTVNDVMTLEVVEIRDGAAVLRIAPAG